MKAGIFYIVLMAVLLMAVPMLALGFDLEQNADIPVHAPVQTPTQVGKQTSSQAQMAEQTELSVVSSDTDGVKSFQIFNLSTGEVEEVSLRNFVRGAVAAEMPAGFHSEALKAQAVAAHTYALHNHLVQQRSPDSALNGADFSADPENRRVYMTEAQVRDFYGEDADEYWEKICVAADSVLEYVMEYDKQPIVAAYHAISAGQTEAASNVWTGSAPYLQPADSAGDLLAPDYETEAVFTSEEIKGALQTAYPDLVLDDDPADWFSGEERTASGYISAITVGGVELHGLDLRETLGLRSHNFTLSWDGEVFRFTVCGYGHGVGLSQYGADYLARQGYTFDEILNHYYTGISLVSVAQTGVL